MKYYKITLLKDLPGIPAGYSFTLDEIRLKDERYSFNMVNQDPQLDRRTFSQHVTAIMQAAATEEGWIKKELDMEKAAPIDCPKCGGHGMFGYIFPDPEIQDNGDIDPNDKIGYWYSVLGLECPHCGEKVRTQMIYAGNSEKRHEIRLIRQPSLNDSISYISCK